MILACEFYFSIMALLDITNSTPQGKKNRKRLSDGTLKVYEYKTHRKQLDILFKYESEKVEFESKLESVKCSMGGKLSMKDILNKLLDQYLCHQVEDSAEENVDIIKESEQKVTKGNRSCLEDETLYIGDVSSAEKYASLVTRHSRLCQLDLQLVSVTKTGHVLILKFQCNNCHEVTWESSASCGDDYNVNYKVLASYICSGMTAVQYEKFCDFSTINIPTKRFRAKVITYLSTIVELLRKTSVASARREEMEASKKQNENGISIMTDARHACRKNSFHSDHIAIGQKTHKIVDVQHITKRDETSSQKHESLGCSMMYDTFDREGIKIIDHAHDRNSSVNKQVKDRQGTTNSNDPWHGTKPIKSAFKKIASGSRANIGRTWHPELSDKGSKFRNHVYHSMEHCNGNAATLRNMLDSCILHFQNNHQQCSVESPCRVQGYIPDYDIVRSPDAVRILQDFIHKQTVYKFAEDFVLARATYYIESYNNSCLIYLDKRIHYQNKMYVLRRDLSVLDWNEHVDRPYTSSYRRVRPDHMGRRSGKKRYKKKTYDFVKNILEHLWAVAGDNRPVDLDSDIEDEPDSDGNSMDESDGEHNNHSS